MIESDYIKDILELTFEGEKFEDLLLEQIEYLILTETDYTGVGCYYYFEHSKEIEKYRLNKNQLFELFREHDQIFENITVINTELNIEAYPMVYLTDGVVDCIEIWNGPGDYPKEELLTYTLKNI